MHMLFIHVQIKTNLNTNTKPIPKAATCIIFDCAAAAINLLESTQNKENDEINKQACKDTHMQTNTHTRPAVLTH